MRARAGMVATVQGATGRQSGGDSNNISMETPLVAGSLVAMVEAAAKRKKIP